MLTPPYIHWGTTFHRSLQYFHTFPFFILFYIRVGLPFFFHVLSVINLCVEGRCDIKRSRWMYTNRKEGWTLQHSLPMSLRYQRICSSIKPLSVVRVICCECPPLTLTFLLSVYFWYSLNLKLWAYVCDLCGVCVTREVRTFIPVSRLRFEKRRAQTRQTGHLDIPGCDSRLSLNFSTPHAAAAHVSITPW